MIRTVLKIALRDFSRRPGQTLLVIAGLVISSLVISAALVAGDSLEQLFLENEFKSWGAADLSVDTLSRQPYSEEVAQRILDSKEVVKLSSGHSVWLRLRGTVIDKDRGTREPVVQLIGVGSESGSLRMSLETSRADGQTPIWINERFKALLQAREGDSLRFTVMGPTGIPADVEGVVAGVASDGAADLGLGANAFIHLTTLQQATGTPGVVNQVLISGFGGPRATRHPAVLIAGIMEAVREANRSGPVPLGVARTKAEDIKGAKEQTRFFRAILGMLGTIVALASIALIANLFVMLGEERRTQRGTMRALGLKRSGLIALGLVEGLLYSAAAAAVGAFVGAFLGRYLADAMGDLFSSFSQQASLEFARPPFELRPRTLLTAGIGGLIVSMVSVFVVSFRTSRMSVISAIRGLPEDRSKKRSHFPWKLIVAAVVGGLLLTGAEPMVVIGGALSIVAVSGLLSRYVNKRLGWTAGAIAGLVWGFWANANLPDFDKDPEAAFGLITLIGVITVVSGVALVAGNLSLVRKLGFGLGSRARTVIRTAAAYADGFRFRTAMSMGMFGLVVYMIAAFAIWGGFGGGDLTKQSGGFEISANTSVPLETLEIDGTEAVGMFATFYSLGYRVGDSDEVRFPARILGVDESFAGKNAFVLSQKKKGDSDREGWANLVRSENTVIVDASTDPGGTKVGDVLTLKTDRGKRSLEVVGVADEFSLGALFISKNTFSELFPSAAGNTSWLLDLPGTKARAAVGKIETKYAGSGADARTLKDLFTERATAQRTFVGIFQLLLKMGLVIGISGLALGSVRTVLERRQAIGILRAIGFRSRMVGGWLVFETLLIATLGVGVGLGVGLLGTYLLIDKQIESFTFSVDWAQIRSTLLIVYISVLAFTAIPAWKAAQMRPSEAVRYVE